MNMHATELQRQHAHYQDVKQRLAGVPFRPSEIQIPDFGAEKDAYERRIGSLQAEIKVLEGRLRSTQTRSKAALAKEAIENAEKVRKLELDLSDARARILSQAEIICKLDVETFDDTARRPIMVIVGEVLRDYPGVKWEDIISVRRNRDLVEPRRACVKAVYDQRPDMSSPQIGKVFRRDHTSILHIVGRTAKARGV